jgi:hypothetical protein
MHAFYSWRACFLIEFSKHSLRANDRTCPTPMHASRLQPSTPLAQKQQVVIHNPIQSSSLTHITHSKDSRATMSAGGRGQMTQNHRWSSQDTRDLYSKFETGAAKYEGFDEDDIRRVKSTEIRWATEDNMHFSNFKSMYEKRAKEFRDRNRPRTSGNTTPAGAAAGDTSLPQPNGNDSQGRESENTPGLREGDFLPSTTRHIHLARHFEG